MTEGAVIGVLLVSTHHGASSPSLAALALCAAVGLAVAVVGCVVDRW